MSTFRFAALGSLLVLNACAAPSTPLKKNLYERLGGIQVIALAADEILDALVANKVITANESMMTEFKKVTPSGLRFQFTLFLAEAAGGPYKYAGKDMKTAHRNMAITQAEWDEMVKETRKVLEKYKVPQAEQNELFALIESTRKDIVTR